MNTKKIHSASIKGAAELGEDTVVTVNGKEFRSKTLNEAVSLALGLLGEEVTKENIVEFIEIAAEETFPAEAYLSKIPPAKKKTKTELVATGVHVLRNTEPGTNLTLNTTLVEVEKKSQTPTFVGKLYTDKEGYVVYEVIKETPPTGWQFELFDLRDIEKMPFTLNLKEFKELKELVPKKK